MDMTVLYKAVVKTLMQLLKDPDSVSEDAFLQLIKELEEENGGDENE